MIQKVESQSYKLDLPSHLEIHFIFHPSLFQPYNQDEEDPIRGESHRAPVTNVISFDKEVDDILADRAIHKRGLPNCIEYDVCWKGQPDT